MSACEQCGAIGAVGKVWSEERRLWEDRCNLCMHVTVVTPEGTPMSDLKSDALTRYDLNDVTQEEQAQ